MIVREQLYRILNLAVQAYGLARNRLPAYSKYVSESISNILGNLSAGLQVETLARRCFVSKSYLEKRFRKEVGVSIGRYIDDQLICAAQEKLEQTELAEADFRKAVGV
jgi:AraC-like DNA-binding protein